MGREKGNTEKYGAKEFRKKIGFNILILGKIEQSGWERKIGNTWEHRSGEHGSKRLGEETGKYWGTLTCGWERREKFQKIEQEGNVDLAS